MPPRYERVYEEFKHCIFISIAILLLLGTTIVSVNEAGGRRGDGHDIRYDLSSVAFRASFVSQDLGDLQMLVTSAFNASSQNVNPTRNSVDVSDVTYFHQPKEAMERHVQIAALLKMIEPNTAKMEYSVNVAA